MKRQAKIDFLREAEAVQWVVIRERRLRGIRRSLRAKMKKLFRAQKTLFFERLPSLQDEFESLREAKPPLPSQWALIFDAVESLTAGDFVEFLDEATILSFAAGGQVLAKKFSLDFKLEHPRAVAYLRDATDKAITGINETTRNRVNTLRTKAVKEGWSWQKLSKEIEQLYDGFSKPPIVANRNYRTRADAIAVFETGDKYEGGAMEAALQSQEVGLEMLKGWGTVGDSRVRKKHVYNEKQGFIPINQPFKSGDGRPPSDPGCRCFSLYRAK